MAKRTIVKLPASLRDQKQFAAALRADAFAGTPPAALLTGLRGRDVVFGVVESYGRSALTDQRMAAVLGPALDAGARQLAAAGFATRSAYLRRTAAGAGWRTLRSSPGCGSTISSGTGSSCPATA
jgi:hypothetical protein